MSSMDASNITVDHMRKLLSEGKRFDGRKIDEFRKFEVSFDVSNKAEGSARVKLGKTEVIAGVKMVLDAPYPDSPDKGNLMVSAELLPLASPRFEQGPPKFDGIELPRLVDRAIRESGMINLKELVVTPGEKVWTVMVDLYPINDDGNLIDAACIAATAAIRNANIPGIKESGVSDYKNRTKKQIPVLKDCLPLSITFYKLGDAIFLDPTREEAESTDVKINFGLSHWSGKLMINSCQKTGPVPFTQEEIEKMMSILPEKYKELNERLKKFL
ncbi:MAG: exosome complex protein Rrp42 [Nanoarchaeota archaeon]